MILLAQKTNNEGLTFTIEISELFPEVRIFAACRDSRGNSIPFEIDARFYGLLLEIQELFPLENPTSWGIGIKLPYAPLPVVCIANRLAVEAAVAENKKVLNSAIESLKSNIDFNEYLKFLSCL